MAKCLRIAAIIIFLISLFLLVVSITSFNLGVVLLSFLGIVIGVLADQVAALMVRVSYLEDKLDLHVPVESENDIAKTTCKSCGAEYDIDYPRCPYCKTKTDI